MWHGSVPGLALQAPARHIPQNMVQRPGRLAAAMSDSPPPPAGLEQHPPPGAEGLLRLHGALLWLEAEVLHVLPEPLVEPLLQAGGQSLAAPLCGKGQRGEGHHRPGQPVLGGSPGLGQGGDCTAGAQVGRGHRKHLEWWGLPRGAAGAAGGATEGLSLQARYNRARGPARLWLPTPWREVCPSHRYPAAFLSVSGLSGRRLVGSLLQTLPQTLRTAQ